MYDSFGEFEDEPDMPEWWFVACPTCGAPKYQHCVYSEDTPMAAVDGHEARRLAGAEVAVSGEIWMMGLRDSGNDSDSL